MRVTQKKQLMARLNVVKLLEKALKYSKKKSNSYTRFFKAFLIQSFYTMKFYKNIYVSIFTFLYFTQGITET